MIYTADITTPHGTAKIDPVITLIKVTKGLVYRVEIEFPPGAAGLHHTVIFDGGFQVWPTSPGVTFHGGWSLIGFDDTYLKLSAPYEFTAYSWNLDETYDHSISIRLGMVSDEVFMARYLPTYAYDHFMKLIKAEAEAQEQRRLEQPDIIFPWLKPQEVKE